MRKREGISLREFAMRDGCSEKLVRRGISRGYITRFPDGSVDQKFIGTGWRESARIAGAMEIAADTPMKPVRAQVSAFPLPIEAETFALAADSWAVDLALILLRHGLPQAEAQAIVEAWLAAARRGAVECLEDVPLPPGCRSWAKHRLFTAPWLGQNMTWSELDTEAAAG